MAAATRARLRVALLILALLTTCGQDWVQVSIGQCWAVSPGDRIEGTARLFALRENDGCVECPSSLSGGAQCGGYDLRIANAVARAKYDRLRQSAPADELGFVHPTVFFVGQAEARRGGGRPVIRVTTLRAPDAGTD